MNAEEARHYSLMEANPHYAAMQGEVMKACSSGNRKVFVKLQLEYSKEAIEDFKKYGPSMYVYEENGKKAAYSPGLSAKSILGNFSPWEIQPDLGYAIHVMEKSGFEIFTSFEKFLIQETLTTLLVTTIDISW